MRSQLRLAALEACTVPQASLETLIVPHALRQTLQDLIGLAKVRRTLVSKWGFPDAVEHGLGATALFSGPPGTGKSLAAEAVAYALGRPLRRVNATQITPGWAGETAKHLETIFREARQHAAVLVFDHVEAFCVGRARGRGAPNSVANPDTAVLLREMERFNSVVILTTTAPDDIDADFRRRLRLTIVFPLPDREAREVLWRQHIPARLPLAPEVSYAALASFALNGTQIRNAVLMAAARAAVRDRVPSGCG